MGQIICWLNDGTRDVQRVDDDAIYDGGRFHPNVVAGYFLLERLSRQQGNLLTQRTPVLCDLPSTVEEIDEWAEEIEYNPALEEHQVAFKLRWV